MERGQNNNYILTPTGKRTGSGKFKYRAIRFNDDCCMELSDRMDWFTWANFCKAYPQFEKFRSTKHNGSIELKDGAIICDVIAKKHRIIKRAHIVDSQELTSEVTQTYKRLTSIEDLTVLNVNNFLNYILSHRLKRLVIGIQQDPDPIKRMLQPETDYVEPILRISRNLEDFTLFNGFLSADSIDGMCVNPIKSLTLFNTAAGDQERLEKFWKTNQHLTSLTLGGCFTGYVMDNYFANNSGKQRIKILEVYVQMIPPDTFFQGLEHFPNLKHLILHYSNSDNACRVYDALLTGNNKLKKIEARALMFMHNLHQDQFYYHNYRETFQRRGIILTRTVTVLWIDGV